MTYSKIGLALHIQFSKWGIILDVDINPPNIPTWNTKHFDGSSDWKLKYLETMLPVGWVDEWDKTVDMRRASAFPECRRSNRFLYKLCTFELSFFTKHFRCRFINRETVLIEQVSKLFCHYIKIFNS